MLYEVKQGEDYVETASGESAPLPKKKEKYFGLSVPVLVLLFAVFFIIVSYFCITAKASTITWYDEDGNTVGTSGTDSAGTVILNNGSSVGIIDPNGSIKILGDNHTINYYNPTSLSSISGEDNAITIELRKLGYTGDEITLALSTGMNTDLLVQEAEKLHDQAAQEALARMSDTAGEEFKALQQHSIFFMQYYDFPEYVNDLAFRDFEGSYIVNADYEKLETYGHQLYIKLKVANNDYAFMSVTPDRWATLPETGNIVVRVYCTMYGLGDAANVYFTNIEEVGVTELTTNPADSTFDLGQITGGMTP